MSVIGSNILAGASGGAGAAGYEIGRSLRFDSSASSYLSRTPSSAGNRKTWTWSGWVKRSKTGNQRLFTAGADGNNNSMFQFVGTDNSQFEVWNYQQGTGDGESRTRTNALFRDFSAWYHIVVSCTTTSLKIYVNGVELNSFAHDTQPNNINWSFNSTSAHALGRSAWGSEYFDGYLADVHFIDGQALAPTDFGEYDDNNVWQPKAYEGTYGTNGFYLDFSDNSSTSALGTDSSGNNNTWTATNFSVASGAGNDSLIDTPTNYTASSGNNGGNYCTWNPLDKDADVTLANGNLDMTQTAGGGVKGTIGVNSGKWYWEITKGSTANQVMGAATSDALPTTYSGGYIGSCGWAGSGAVFANGADIFTKATTATIDATTTGDVLGFALDLDSATKTLKFYKNGSLLTGNHIVIADSNLHIHPLIGTNVPDSGANATNFGQRPFAYTPPTDHLPLCTTNLPDPTIADGSTAFDAKLYTGDGTGQTITDLGFSPDLVWIKQRNATRFNVLFDTVRGANKRLISNNTDAETTQTDHLSAFTSDGFTVQTSANVNVSSGSYVAWTWDAGSSTVSNTDGSITSSVRANTSAGFSILTAPVDSSGGTIGHGLNASPGLIIGKNRDAAANWTVWHSSLGTTQYVLLSTGTVGTSSTVFNGVSSTTFTVGNGWSASSASHVFYCWAPVEGYSKFGSYEGLGQGSAPFIYTGFRPRWVMIKNIDYSSAFTSWFIQDSERAPTNSLPGDQVLYANRSAAEGKRGDGSTAATTELDIDFVSNGFKISTTGTHEINFANNTFIYAAFAEHPFKTARAR